jgi:hypothetical protein
MGIHSEVQMMRISILDLVSGDSYSWKLVGIIHTVIQFRPVLAIRYPWLSMLPNAVSVIPDLG